MEKGETAEQFGKEYVLTFIEHNLCEAYNAAGLANYHTKSQAITKELEKLLDKLIAGRSKSLERERELEEALRDLYNAIDSLPNWKKRDTLAQHCDMEKAKQLLNNH